MSVFVLSVPMQQHKKYSNRSIKSASTESHLEAIITEATPLVTGHHSSNTLPKNKTKYYIFLQLSMNKV